jgi:hypothetical protein
MLILMRKGMGWLFEILRPTSIVMAINLTLPNRMVASLDLLYTLLNSNIPIHRHKDDSPRPDHSANKLDPTWASHL